MFWVWKSAVACRDTRPSWREAHNRCLSVSFFTISIVEEREEILEQKSTVAGSIGKMGESNTRQVMWQHHLRNVVCFLSLMMLCTNTKTLLSCLLSRAILIDVKHVVPIPVLFLLNVKSHNIKLSDCRLAHSNYAAFQVIQMLYKKLNIY